MARLIGRGEIEKIYRAVTRGTPQVDAFVIDVPLAKDAAKNQVRAATPEEQSGMSERARQAFQAARTSDPAGVGYGILLYWFDRASKKD